MAEDGAIAELPETLPPFDKKNFSSIRSTTSCQGFEGEIDEDQLGSLPVLGRGSSRLAKDGVGSRLKSITVPDELDRSSGAEPEFGRRLSGLSTGSYVSVHGSEQGSEPGSEPGSDMAEQGELDQFQPVDREGSNRADSYHNAIPEIHPSPQPPPPKGQGRPMSYTDAQATAPTPSLTVENTNATPVPPTASALRARAMSQPETAATSSPTDGADHHTSKFETTGRSASLSLGATPSAAKEKKKRRFKFKNMFKPWKWKRKKPAAKIELVAAQIERRISFRPPRDVLIAKGIAKPEDISEDATVLTPDSLNPSPTPGADPSTTGFAIKVVDDDAGEVENWQQLDVPVDNKFKLRQDSLGGKLARRPDHGSLRAKNIIRENKPQEAKFDLVSKLERRLSSRGSKKDLADRNIIRSESAAEAAERRKSLRGILQRRLSRRMSAKELRKKGVLKFHEFVDVYDAAAADDYDRKAEKPWTKLTNADKIAIKRELNEFKRDEMPVHTESEKYTRFHK